MRLMLRVKGLAALLAGVSVLLTGPVSAQINIDAYRDYFLVGQFGEVCTMCEVVVLCAKGDAEPAFDAIPETGSFTVYHLETRTFWSQVSTIWEWFMANFTAESLAASGHARPVNVYNVTDGIWAAPRTLEARVILDPGVLEFGDRHINRVDRSWLDAASAEPLGYCQRLPLWESLDRINARVAGGAQ